MRAPPKSDTDRMALEDWLDPHPQAPLTDDETRRLRKLLQDDDRATWLRKQVRVFVPWIFGVVSGLYVAWNFIAGHWK